MAARSAGPRHVRAVQGIELLLDIGQHWRLDVVPPGVERHLVFHHMGRTDFPRPTRRRRRPAPPAVPRVCTPGAPRRAPRTLHASRKTAGHHFRRDDLAHEASLFPGRREFGPFPLIIVTFENAQAVFMNNLQVCHHTLINQSAKPVPHTSRSFSGRQAALAGLVLGSLTAAMPLMGCKYLQ